MFFHCFRTPLNNNIFKGTMMDFLSFYNSFTFNRRLLNNPTQQIFIILLIIFYITMSFK